MTQSEAIDFGYAMWAMWRSSTPFSSERPYDFDLIRESMLQDLRYRRGKPTFAGVTREIRGQLVKIGKARKALQQ
jgi:hypothetical protein